MHTQLPTCLRARAVWRHSWVHNNDDDGGDWVMVIREIIVGRSSGSYLDWIWSRAVGKQTSKRKQGILNQVWARLMLPMVVNASCGESGKNWALSHTRRDACGDE